jgi:hypothetical protein
MRTDNRVRRQFLSGLVLSWSFPIVLLATLVPLFLRERTTGIGAVAGGLWESLVNFGLLAAIAFQVGAIILLFRVFRDGKSPLRGFLSVTSICCASIVLMLCGVAFVGRFLH